MKNKNASNNVQLKMKEMINVQVNGLLVKNGKQEQVNLQVGMYN